jgi:hypothetical protein
VRIDISALREPALADKKYFDTFFGSKTGFMSCEYSFANLFCWRRRYKTVWALMEEGFPLLYGGLEDYILFPPLDEPSADLVLRISDAFAGAGKSGTVYNAPRSFVEKNKEEISRHFEIEHDGESAEYIYLTESLRDLRGDKLHKKKNLAAQFERENSGARGAPIDSRETLEDCYRLAEAWGREKNGGDLSATGEGSALREALDNYFELGLEGFAIYLDRRLLAFSICSRLNRDTYDEHFEKYDISVKGAAQAVNRLTAASLCGKCLYLNREQDMGLPGLAKAKQSYCPLAVEPTFMLRRLR